MKNKRLIIILSVFAILVLIAVLCSTVFTVKDVSINWLTTSPNISQSDEEFIQEVEKGQSVFLVDKTSIAEKLETKYPYLKVVSVEIKFPNKLVIHTAERQELYSVKIKDNKHAILDSDCKVLRFVTDSQLSSIEVKPIVVDVQGYTIKEDIFEVSKFAELGWIKNVLNNFSVALYSCGYEDIDAKNNIDHMQINVGGYDNKINMTMRYGVEIEIQQISDKLNEKFAFAMGIYDKLSEEEKSVGIIKTYTVNGVVKGEYDNLSN